VFSLLLMVTGGVSVVPYCCFPMDVPSIAVAAPARAAALAFARVDSDGVEDVPAVGDGEDWLG
jgi:hypothetical protein